MTNSRSAAASTSTRRKGIRAGIAVGVAAVLIVVAVLSYRPVMRRIWPAGNRAHAAQENPVASVELVPGSSDSLHVQPEVVERLGIMTAEAQTAQIDLSLQLSGTLSLDASQLEEVRSRFAGEVVEIGMRADDPRPVQFGDRVTSGQLLAVVWSRELGEKKSELVDALSQFRLHSETLRRLQKLYQDGAIPEREYREAERTVETDRIAVARVTRTLQTWRVADDDIAAVEAEAKKLIGNDGTTSSELAERWARVEVRSAIDGVVLERNVAVGDIVAPSDDLFKVADLSRLRVLAFAYEEDLPQLDALTADQRRWTITVPANPQAPPQSGAIGQIGHIIDPTQHTALVMGWVDNSNGILRAGQFIAAAVALPPPGNEVVVPASALIEKGGEDLVFVKTADDPVFTQRRVSLSRRVGEQVCFHIDPPEAAGQPDVSGLKPGEEVVTSGAVELQQALTDLTASRSEPANANSGTKPK